MLPSPSAPSAGKESEGDGEKEATKVTTEVSDFIQLDLSNYLSVYAQFIANEYAIHTV